MDRREFLKSSGVTAAAAATTATAAVAADASVATTLTSPLGAPAVASGVREFVLAVPASIDTLDVGASAYAIARRLETAFGDGTRVTLTRTIESGLEAVMTGSADLYLGLESQHATFHPAFHAFAGLPFGEHLDGAMQHAWMRLGSGHELFDELAGQFGIRAVPAGVTGVSPGLYAERLFDTAADLRGMKIACRGLARDVVTSLGAQAVTVRESDLAGAISAQALDAAEPLTAPTSAVAHWTFQPGLTPGGFVMTLGTRTSLWSTLGASGQAILDGVAAEAYALSSAEAIGRTATLRRIDRMRRWPVVTAFASPLQHELQMAGQAAVDRVASYDPLAGRVIDSIRAFRGQTDQEVASAHILNRIA